MKEETLIAIRQRLLKLTSTGQVRRCQLAIARGRKGVGPTGTRHSALHPTTCLPKLVLCLLGCNVSAPLLPPSVPRPLRFQSALRMESPTHKIDHPSSSLSVIMLNLSPRLHPHPAPREQELQQESSRRRHGRYQLAALLVPESELSWSSSQLLLLLLLRSLS